MRRLLAITLLLLFGLPVVTPLFALSSSVDASLPACCRKNGAHHCAMRTVAAPSVGTAFRSSQQPCPAYPAAVVQARQREIPLLIAFHLSAEMTVHSAATHQPALPARFMFDRSQQQRGPPSLIV